MFIKKIKKYNLNDIHRLLLNIPMISIFVLIILSIISSYFILENNKNKKIDLIKQEYLLKYDFNQREYLDSFKEIIDKKTKKSFLKGKSLLQKITFETIGYIKAKKLKNLLEMDNYIQKVEKDNAISLVIFSYEDLNILYGKNSILYLQNLIFSMKSTKNKLDLTLKYISSQGENNLQYWRDDLKETLRLSFFDEVFIDSKRYFVGALSTISSSKKILKDSIIETIKFENKDIWFYDIFTKKIFNFNSNRIFINSNILLKQKGGNVSYKILEYYNNNLEFNKKFEKFTYLYSKYGFLISTFYNKKLFPKYLDNKIFNVKQEYKKLFLELVVIIFLIGIALIIFNYIFSIFVKNIFNKFNRRLEKKTNFLMHWKKRFELAVIASNDGLWDINFISNKVYFSKKWLDMFDYERDEIKSFSQWFNLIHNEDKKKVKKLFDKIFKKTADTIICEYRLKTKNRGFIWVLARGKAFYEEGKLSRIIMMSMDIDKNKRMKKELLDVELLVEDGKIVIFKLVNDEKLTIKYISNSIKNFGYIKQSFKNNNISFLKLIYKEDIKKLKAIINSALSKGLSNFTFICRISNISNEIRWISSRVIIIKNHIGQVSGFYGYINDITKIKLSQEELKDKIQEELDKNRQKDRLLIQQNKMAAMGEMLGNIAHQWRQPLNNVSLILQFIRDSFEYDSFDDKSMDKFIKKANKHIEYMSETIDDFRNFYKPSKLKSSFSLNLCIESLLKMIQGQFNNENIFIHFSCDELIIYNYENEFKQALLNILNNAKDAILEKKQKKHFNAHIKIYTQTYESRVKIFLQNNAGCIKKDIIDKIFDPYFTTKFENQGTGIGLYMTKAIIETNMKGKLEVENLDDAVRFIITLTIKEEKNE